MRPEVTYLSTDQLAVGYRSKAGENRVLSDLNLTLRESEMICFMGPNGAGKSSLIRTIAGFQKPLSGTVITHPVNERHEREQHIAVVLTDRVHAVNLTVEEVVSFGRYPYLGWNVRLSDRDREIVQTAVAQVRIQPLLRKKLYELSDGQMQMVMIARALAQDTPVMLLDEPTAHLDLNNRVEIMNILRHLSRSTKKAILLATHELDLALQTADRIWLTGKDRNILEGLPEDLVLNGAFDDIFRFKGYDLKSGKVLHEPFRRQVIRLLGEGPAFLWTKNALERNGFAVGDSETGISVVVSHEEDTIRWTATISGTQVEVTSIERLVDLL